MIKKQGQKYIVTSKDDFHRYEFETQTDTIGSNAFYGGVVLPYSITDYVFNPSSGDIQTPNPVITT